MNSKAKIKEIFTSIQGEGPYIGYNQLFIRFCGCNLNCNYCDTPFDEKNSLGKFDVDELLKYINSNFELGNVHSVSLTGGEPLLYADFLKKFLPELDKKIYLETNATLFENLLIVKPFVSVVAADIKLESASGVKNSYYYHDKFFKNCKGVETFAKIVFDKNITNDEIKLCSTLANKHGIPLILQPVTTNNIINIDNQFVKNIFNKFLNEYKNVRVIPQVHKLIGIE